MTNKTSTKAADKASRELEIFEQFAELLRKWNVSVTEVKSQPQGFADVSALLGGESIGFELLSIVDERLAAGTNLHTWADVDDKLSAKLLKKNYRDNCPVELLIYSRATILPTDMILHESQKALWTDQQGPFRRVWFLSEDNRIFLFHKNWWSQLGLLLQIQSEALANTSSAH